MEHKRRNFSRKVLPVEPKLSISALPPLARSISATMRSRTLSRNHELGKINIAASPRIRTAQYDT